MPSMFGKDAKKKDLIKNLESMYTYFSKISPQDFYFVNVRCHQIQQQQHMSSGDFPNIPKMQEQLAQEDFTRFYSLDRRLLDRVDR